MDEYISREALLVEIAADYGKWISCNDTDELYRQGVEDNYSDTIRLINDMPSADVQPVNQWINVNDRLPDETEVTVLIWIKEGKADGIEISDCCHIAYWVKDSKKFCDIDWNVINGITHWMPMPEPPKDGEHND